MISFGAVNEELLNGFLSTILLFALSLVIALPLGLLVALLARSRLAVIRYITKTFIWVIRGTPLLLQIIVIFYLPGIAVGISMSAYRFQAAVAALSINYAAYFGEIYRSGIAAIPKGQWEAADVLGLSRFQAYRKIIMPQVIRNILPPMANEVMSLVKDTALARIISVVEILKVAQEIVSINGIIWPLFYVGVFYLFFIGILTLIFRFAEKKMNYYQV